MDPDLKEQSKLHMTNFPFCKATIRIRMHMETLMDPDPKHRTSEQTSLMTRFPSLERDRGYKIVLLESGSSDPDPKI